MKAMLVFAAAATAALAAAAPALAQGGGCPPAHHARAAYHPVRRHLARRVEVRTVYVTRIVRVPAAYPVRTWAPPPRPYPPQAYPVEYRHHWREEGYEHRDARFAYPRDDWRADVYRY